MTRVTLVPNVGSVTGTRYGGRAKDGGVIDVKKALGGYRSVLGAELATEIFTETEVLMLPAASRAFAIKT